MPSDFRQTSSALRSDRDRGRRSIALFAVIGTLLILIGLVALVGHWVLISM
jgi:hypothetical protein